MKVGMLTQSVSRRAGGIFEVMRGLSMALHRPPELEVRVFGVGDDATAADLSAWGAVPVEVASAHGPRSFGFSPGLGPRIGAAAPDLLHVHGLWAFSSVAARRWSAGGHRAYLISPHGMLDHRGLQNSRWKKRIALPLYERGHLRRAACLHALSDAEYKSIRAFGLRNPVCVIPNGVDPVEARAGQLPSWRKYLPERAKVLLYLGRLHPIKGLANLLEGWDEAHRNGGDAAAGWHLVIAGWDQVGHRSSLEEIALQRKITDRVHFVGPRFGAEKDATFRAADAFILPSLSEGVPMAVLEAWAYGLPVLMTPQCNLREGFARRAALPIEATPEGIADQLGGLFAMSNNCRREFGARGLELSRTQFNWDRTAAQMAFVYRWICGTGPQPDCVHLT